MANKWLEHVKKFKQENTGMQHKEALQKARETYNKNKIVRFKVDNKQPKRDSKKSQSTQTSNNINGRTRTEQIKEEL